METRRCVFVGVGGQGNLLASRLLGEASLSMNIPVVVSEIHGMAQRGGVVESAVLMGDVTSPIISEGEADILVGFEPLETMRTLVKCSKKSVVITNTQAVPPFTVSTGHGSYPPVDEILGLIHAKVGKVIALNGNTLAKEAGNSLSLNMVMLGALIGSGSVLITGEAMRETIESSTKRAFLESNLKAFDLGMKEAEKCLA